MAAKQKQSKEDLIKDLIKDRTYMRRVAHGYEMQVAPGVWLQGAFLAQGQDRFIVDAARLQAGLQGAFASLGSQDDANFAAAALLRLKTAGVDLNDAQLRQALAGAPYALTLVAALDADLGAAFLLGSGGADRLTGTAGNDTLAGNRGDDLLEGGAGSDTYLFSAGDGHDTIVDNAGSTDTIRFGAGITPAMLGFRRAGQDLVVGVEGSADQLTIAGWGTGAANQIERFELADGTVWDAATLAEFVAATAPIGTAGADTLQGWDSVGDEIVGGAGDDVLYGGGGDDVLVAGSGNDTLRGGTGTDELVGGIGGDVYLFERGDGRDTVYDYGRNRGGPDGALDTVRFGAGIAAADIVLHRENDALVFAIAGTDDRIAVSNWNWGADNRIERVEFADGTVWQAAELEERIAGTSYVSGAGEGDDTISAWSGFDDLLQGYGGNDYLAGSDGDDILEGGTGNDELLGGGGNNTYRFARGDGMDRIYDGGDNQGTIAFGPGIAEGDIVMARSGNDVVIRLKDSSDQITVSGWAGYAGNGVERFVFADGASWDAAYLNARVEALDIAGTDGTDYLNGNARDNTFIGGAGDDILYGGGGSDVYRFARGDGHDTINEYYDGAVASQDTIRFGPGIAAADITLTRVGGNVVFGIKDGDDSITVTGQGYGAPNGVERVEFADGSAWNSEELRARVLALPYVGTDGDDTLTGDQYGNVLAGGRGNDTLRGYLGSDTYLFERGDGQDSIEEYSYGAGEVDTLRFGAGIGPGDIVLSRSGNDLVLSIAGSDDRVTVRQWNFGDASRIDQVAFADGTVWDRAALAAMVAPLPFLGTDGDDNFSGDEAANTFDGGAGNDTMRGGGGDDTYLFERGDGHDTIQEWDGYGMGSSDTLRFGAGIAAADVTLRRSADGVVFEIAGNGGSVTVMGWTNGRVEQVVFADGTIWTAAAVGDMIAGLPVLGTDGNDNLVGDDNANTIDGGAGNDNLSGGNGGDTYLFERGDGQDSIQEAGYGNAGIDTIRFGAGIGAADIVLSRSGNDLVFAIAGSDDRITVRGWTLSDYYRIEQVAFADGTVWDAAALAAMAAAIPITGTDWSDALNGDDGANILDGGAGNDILRGGNGSDTYLFERGDGQDSIEDGGYGYGDVDTLRFGAGIGAGDVVLSRSGNDLVLGISGSADRVTVRNWTNGVRIEQVAFADGTVWDAAALAAMVAAIPIAGTDGDDVLTGDEGGNTFDGGTGKDILRGGAGSDTYLFERGDGQDTIQDTEWYSTSTDTIRFGAGITAADVVLRRSADGIVFEIAGGGDSVTVQSWAYGQQNRVEQVAFADGTVWSAAALADMVAALPVLGTDGNDTLVGDENANTIDGGAGNDTLQGGYGSDTYLFERGDGQDSIEEGTNAYGYGYGFGYGYGYGEVDTLRFGAGIGAGDIVFSRSGNDVVLALAGSDDRITLRNWGYGDSYRIEQVAFADGTVWDAADLAAKVAAIPIAGTDGNDVLSGDSGPNVFDGGAGNDTLLGGWGSDTYLFERGDGQDSIEDGSYGYGEVDTIRFGAGIGAADIVLSRSGDDLVFGVAGSEDRVTVRNWRYGDYYRIEQVAFADGTVWDAAALAARVAAIPITGTDGDDVLVGDYGPNTFDGGAGNDTLRGGSGGDTYLFERGDGQDSIDDDGGDASVDTLRFGAGIGAADIVLSRSGSDLVFSVAGTGDRVAVRNWSSNTYYRIEQVAFADGTSWDAAALAAMVAALPVQGGDGDDFLVGDENANTVVGGAGNDSMQGKGGSDTYLFERGDGQDSIEEAGYYNGWGDVDVIRFGAGIAAGDISLSFSGDDLVFSVAGGSDRIAVRSWRNADGYRIEQVAFADGTVWDAGMLAAMVAAIPLTGTDGDDVLYGDAGANTFDGGAGNDSITGSDGADTYLFERGDGQDSIYEAGYDTDTIRFGAGIGADDIVLSRSGNDLVLAIAGGTDRITLRNWSDGDYYRVEQVAFADGTVWDAAALAAKVAAIPIAGTDGDDYLSGDGSPNTFDGGAGNDILQGGYGADTYLFERGDGQDSIAEAGYDVDTIRFGAGIAAADVVVSREGNDLVFALAGTSDRITVRDWRYGDYYRIEQVAFADGTVWDAAVLKTLAVSRITGTDGDDYLSGDSEDNLLDGGAGNDILRGGYGGDTYVFELGGGQDRIEDDGYGGVDTLRFGADIAAADVVLSRSGNDLVFAIGGSDDRVTVGNWRYGDAYRIEQVAFADGTVWDATALAAMVQALPLAGTDGDDYLSGDSDANTFDGGAGNDSLFGYAGADTYVFERGDGQDSIEEGGYDVDTIRFGADIGAADIVISREGSDLVFAIAGSGDRVTVRNWAYGDYYRIEQVAFADGTVWNAAAIQALATPPVIGTDGDDYLYGNDEDNLLDGRAGNDILLGGWGNDTYVFEAGSGQDSIQEDSGADTIRFGAGIAAADIVLSREGSDLVLAVAGTDDRVTVRYWGDGDYYRIEQVVFADGTVWDGAALRTMANLPRIGTDGADYLLGDGEDNLFDGGAGDDVLAGGWGADTYVFELGDGQDSIDESGYDVDTIRFGAGIAAADIVVSREDRNLVFAVAGTDDRVTVRSWGYGDSYRIEQIVFADGTVWDAAAVEALANLPYIGTDGDDYLFGDEHDNLFDGGAGNDTLQGEYGADTYVFERGDGQDWLYESGWDGDTVRFGAGIAAGDVVLSRESGALVLALAGTDDRIAVANWYSGDYYRIDRVEFADGTVWDAAQLDGMAAGLPILGTEWDDTLQGDDGDNVLAGGAGYDYLYGGAGGDTYVFGRGDGLDRVIDVGSDPARPDAIRFGEGIVESDVSVSRNGSSVVFTVNDGGGEVEVMYWEYGDNYRIERVEFADGSAWDAAAIDARIVGGEAAPAGFAEPGLGAWALSSSLLAFSLNNGGAAALGGESGAGYGSAAQLPADSAQALLAGAEFGKPRQAV